MKQPAKPQPPALAPTGDALPTLDEIVAAIRAHAPVPQSGRAFVLVEFGRDEKTNLTGFQWTNYNIPIAEARRWLLADVAEDMRQEAERLAAKDHAH